MSLLGKLFGKKQGKGSGDQDFAGAKESFEEISKIIKMADSPEQTWRGTSVCSHCGGMDFVLTKDREAFLPGGRKSFCKSCQSPIEYKWEKA